MLEGLIPLNALKPCRIRTIVAELEEKDAAILNEALENEDVWSVNGLSVALKQRGIKVSPDAITRHRKGICSC